MPAFIKVMRCSRSIAALTLASLVLGCATTVEVPETYLRPAEIDMSGKKTVVLESQGVYRDQGAAVISRLKQSLMVKEFTVADRSAMDAVAREQFFGDGQSAEITAASVLIRINVLSHSKRSDRENKTEERGKDEDRRTVYLRRTVGEASSQVSFDVVDLATTQTIVSKTFSAKRSAQTNWDEQTAGSVDTSALLSRCYDDVVAKFMRQIAPYAVQVEHDLYPMEKEYPQTKVGVSFMQAGRPDQAFEQFESAFMSAQADAEVEPKTLSLLIHNMAVAKERDGQYEAALALYIDSTRYEGSPDQSENIERCRTRIRDYDRLIQQGVDTSATPVMEAGVTEQYDSGDSSSLGDVIDTIESIGDLFD